MNAHDSLVKELESHRKYLQRYALFHLRDSSAADDAVQETLIAAVAQIATFEGRSELRTWLTAILKRKIVDQIRQRERHSPVEAMNDGDPCAPAEGFFGERGRWSEPPTDWGIPDAALESMEFWRVYVYCCERMQKRHALAFSMREVMGMSTEEICAALEISTTNLHVMLYRARLSLQACMTKEWFNVSPA